MKRLICKIFGHQYFQRKRLDFYTRCVGCHRCKRYWGMNDSVKALIPWDEELSELYGYNPWFEDFRKVEGSKSNSMMP